MLHLSLRECCRHVEESMTETLLANEIPIESAALCETLKEGKDETLEGKFIKVADKVDLLYMIIWEIQKGNTENIFAEI